MASKKRLFLFLTVIFSGFAYASPLGDIIRDIDAASAKVFNFCTYSIKYKDGKGGPETVLAQFRGNAFFIEHGDLPHTALTNKHVVSCGADASDLKGILSESTIEAIDSISAVSSLKTKWGIRYFKTVLADFPINKDPNIDFAVLEIEWPDDVPMHGHSLISTDESDYDFGTDVIVRGYMPCSAPDLCDEDGWVRRLKFANIEGFTKDKIFIQLNTAAYSGMSGSPVLILKNGVPHVVGIFAIAYVSSRIGTIDMSWATRLKKEYFDRPKKP